MDAFNIFSNQNKQLGYLTRSRRPSHLSVPDRGEKLSLRNEINQLSIELDQLLDIYYGLKLQKHRDIAYDKIIKLDRAIEGLKQIYFSRSELDIWNNVSSKYRRP